MAGNTVLSDEEDEIEVEEDEREEPEGDAVDPEDRDDDEDDEEDEEGEDAYEKDGFIVDEVDEDDQDGEDEDREDSDEERQRKKKRKKRESEKNYVLDDDDYELLQDNVGFRRPKVSNKFKRLKKARADADEGQSGFSDEEEFDGTGKSGRSAEDKIKRSLFDDDEGAPMEDIAEDDQREEEEDGDIGEEEDEMADFIVDEEEVDEHGEPTRRRKVNKKKSRQAPGVSSTAMQEAHDIFGDVDELLRQRKLGLERINRYDDTGERRLEDEFEPIILSEKYMTENDDRIREIDIPERMQVSEESTGPPPIDGMSIDEESNWILNQLGHERAVLKKDIVRFLELMHVQKLDVPFIAMYRKEECRSLFKDEESPTDNNKKSDESNPEKPTMRWHKVLWAISELDRKWLLLQKRKTALQLYYDKRFQEERFDETRLDLNQKLFDSTTKSLKVAESDREIDDVDSKFNLHFPPGDVGIDEGQFKRPKRKSQYSICSKSGLWEVATKFGYSSEEFGLLISLEQMRRDELEDAKETPEEVASRFTCAMFENPQAVLRGARHMAAVEISCEPCVRRHVRSIFMDNAVVSTTPTADGNTSIDSHHQFAGIKWLKNKPLTKFDDAQWLLIQKAEEEKLIQVSVKLPAPVHNKLIDDAHEYYLSEGVSKSAQLWNEQRKQIIKDAFDGLLLPSMAKEARSLLTSRAKNWLLMEYGRLLWDKVSVAPYQKKDQDVNSSSDDYEVAPRVMACCWGPGKPATTFVMLDSYGEVLDVLYAGSLSARGQSSNDQQRKSQDQQRLLKFMTDHQPHVVVLGAVNMSCVKLREDIFEIIGNIFEDNPRAVGLEMDNISIVYADETLPHLYENSRISSDQLQPQSGIVKRAVALGRYLQNPLAMAATLCGPAKEILSWKLSPLECFLTPDEKYSMVEQIMVDATNQVGLDVNLAISHEWLFAPLQFISGLGPRKAASLQRSLVRAGSIYTRKDLLAHGLGKKGFVNAVGFLRVRRSGNAASSSQFIDLLDDTRIHPESYTLAQELAKDMCTHDDEDDVNEDEDLFEMAIENVRDNPHNLKRLDVDNYSSSKKLENKKDTLNHMRLELIQGFQDWRKPYAQPNADELFYMLSGETEETLSEGKIVQATVRRVQPQRAICILESGVSGMLSKEDYSDERRDIDLTESLNEGDVLTCMIKSVLKDRRQVFLSCKDSDLRSDRSQNFKNMDPYYYEDRDNSETEKEKARKAKELAKKHFKSRMIVHPRFQNITADEAMEMLSVKEPGESIVRPSSRGPSYLTLTLKIYDGVYAHKDIIEGGKENKDITSMLRIGKTLKIGDDVFEDLDEVMDRYVDPLVTHLKTMLGYRKFRDGAKAEVDESLRKEKFENPSRIVYAFGISHEYPGTFILTYIRSSNPHHEYVGLYPKGFKFRKKMFEEIDRLVAYFQRHVDDPHEAGPSIRSVAAMVPMRSPAPSHSFGSVGGSNSDVSRRGSSGDRERTSTPSSRTGRSDYRNGGGHDSHPSGVPRPYGGRGRVRGRGSYHHRGNEGGSGRSKDVEDEWKDRSWSDDRGGGGNGSKRVQSQASSGSSAGWASGW
ncbi:transcription elongation factor SPT6 homolog isoform X2 [Rutidosis leptorrhynchoides]|uniref:transcription elongation factor SPT6 homolog isoform X2 n=1 Tax=Rutidosis leptorrhynchoides TaxID=125765 RepID=UPI003A99F67B